MEFFSPRFLLSLVVLVGLLPLLRSASARRFLLTLASCFFYASWDWRYLGLLLLVSGIDWVAAGQIERQRGSGRDRWWLAFSLLSNLGILAYFKYWNFLLGTVGMPLSAMILPAGISFYTFKTMSYTIDVYRGHLKACQSWQDYALFVTFFPDLIAGPIVRASVFLPQLQRRPGLTREGLVVGLNLFVQGLTKKILVADRLGEVAEAVFLAPSVFSTGAAWMGLIAYAGQIYCDFSGYSDMAVGTARMLGYDLPLNFRLPYTSLDVGEFWKRWHITLSQWLRDYLYIPLGGNRSWTRRNLMITMLLGGLWHGASWNFVLWGGIHGLALIVHRAWKGRGYSLNAPCAWLLTQLFVVLAWVPFRAASSYKCKILWHRLLLPAAGQTFAPHWFLVCMGLLAMGHGVGLWLERAPLGSGGGLGWAGLSAVELPLAGRYLIFDRVNALSAFLVTMWLGLLFFFCATGASPFIYFQF